MSSKPIADLLKTAPVNELIKLAVVSLLTFIFAIAVIYVVLKNEKNESLQVLTGLLGLTIGYLVGKADSSTVQR